MARLLLTIFPAALMLSCGGAMLLLYRCRAERFVRIVAKKERA